MALVLIFAVLVSAAFPRLQGEERLQPLCRGGPRLQIGIQSIINVGVNLQLLPAKGMTLPLISMIAIAVTAGFILALTRHRPSGQERSLFRVTGVPAE